MSEIARMIPPDEILAQLAEECMELGHAALKLRRAMRGDNPTPVTYGEAVRALNEEIADVKVCLDALAELKRDAEIERMTDEKARRWLSRLQEDEDGPEA